MAQRIKSAVRVSITHLPLERRQVIIGPEAATVFLTWHTQFGLPSRGNGRPSFGGGTPRRVAEVLAAWRPRHPNGGSVGGSPAVRAPRGRFRRSRPIGYRR